MTPRVHIAPTLWRWARERSGLQADTLEERFPRLTEWETGRSKPTLKQAEAFAHATHTPIGYLFLDSPPDEQLPIPDFRVGKGGAKRRPSADLLEMIYVCQQRQDWYRDYARAEGEPELSFVGSVRIEDDHVGVAAQIREALGFDLEDRRRLPTWTDALRRFLEQADEIGLLVMCSGVVLNDTRRHLDPDEFRGFTLVDPVAPVVFINGSDSKAAQMFTLAHELAHIWLGESGVSQAEVARPAHHTIEKWCDKVAAELLVPLAAFHTELRRDADLEIEVQRLAKIFKVSSLVVLRRMHDAGVLTWHELWEAHAKEVERILAIPHGSGGNFYLTQTARVSRRFARALVVSTWEGRSTFTEAFRLLGIRRMETFRGMTDRLQVAS